MPSVVKRTGSSLVEVRREILHAVSWQVRSNLWNPPTDEYETETAYVVRVEIAGMREEDFEVILENNLLQISGFRSDLLERRAYHQMEIRFGKFLTSIEIPGAVDSDAATAEYKEGLLTVILPKAK